MIEAVNTHDQLMKAGGGIAIVPHHTMGRNPVFYGWAIYRVDANGTPIVTDPEAPWYYHGRKVFTMRGINRMEALAEAKKWVNAQFAERGPWVRNRMHDYVPARINKAFPLQKKS